MGNKPPIYKRTGPWARFLTFRAKVVRRFRNTRYIHVNVFGNELGRHVKMHGVCRLVENRIGDYTYFGGDASVQHATIGKFCSIGPNFICGWGIHPTEGLSTAPMFYSTARQNGITLVNEDRFTEHLPVTIGNDVFIGANVMIMDGVTIGDGAVIGAGAIVTKDVQPYAIVGGIPAKVLRYRFAPQQIAALERIRWWDFSDHELKSVGEYFNDIDAFIEKYDKD